MINNMDAACRLIKAATGEEYGDGDRVTDIGRGIAEPGYGGSDVVWVMGNWNPKRYPRDGEPPLTKEENIGPRLANALERIGVELLWLDEWMTCGHCYKAIRCEPNSYSWQPYYVDDGECCDRMCLDCFAEFYSDSDQGLRDFGFINDPQRAVPDSLATDAQLGQWGYERHNGVFENGWYGREDDPEAVFNAIQERNPSADVVFRIDQNQQFCLRFTAWVKQVWREHDSGVVEVFRVDEYQDENAGVDIVTCGDCMRSWDDSHASAWTPAPSGRCPFEYGH